VVLIGSGSIGVAIARRVRAEKHILHASVRRENIDAAAAVFMKRRPPIENGHSKKVQIPNGRSLICTNLHVSYFTNVVFQYVFAGEKKRDVKL
jgi:hypothetical protein